MAINQPFFPSYGLGQIVAPTSTAAAVIVGGNNKNLELTVPVGGTQIVYVRVTANDDTSDATNADYPLLPGITKVISKAEQNNRVSYFAAGSGSTLMIIPGEGY